MENGYDIKGHRDIDDLIDKLIPKMKVFYSVKEYTDAYTLFNRLEMDNFVFIYVFFSMWSLILVIFIIHLVIKRLLLLEMNINIQTYYNRLLAKVILIRNCEKTN